MDESCVGGAEGDAVFARQRREKEKHRRDPGSKLHPFVVDCRGRWGRETTAWVALVLKGQPMEPRAALIRKLRVAVSVAVQAAVAAPLICAVRVPRTATPPTKGGGGLGRQTEPADMEDDAL